MISTVIDSPRIPPLNYKPLGDSFSGAAGTLLALSGIEEGRFYSLLSPKAKEAFLQIKKQLKKNYSLNLKL
ncbi:hypothetical protein J2B92_22735 [Lysinibacillus sphaericus]|uniref:hypothetical protein n=1 Tax=Lysinibacillus sphaericus TaxID=1421 RepID=UPI0019D5F1B7|nr:hypothetical protein [Lysinibacillus sphaericus]MBG9757751.1 hypothetical protein [Lysinibacillus sphaericus]QTB13518.1 hypothetical protein J2B92_22735 [Lysinibacillus sphaericus]